MAGYPTSAPGAPSIVDGSVDGQSALGIVPGLLWAFRIHDDGRADALPIDQPIEIYRDGWLWLHLDLVDTRATQWIRAADLPEIAVATMLSRSQHQQLHATGSCIYGIFADLQRRIEGVCDEVGHLRFIMTERLLISGRHQPLSAVDSARTAIAAGEHRLPHVAALLELIVEHVAEAIDQLADNLLAELDHVEDCLAGRT